MTFICSSTKNSETFSKKVTGINSDDAEAYFRNSEGLGKVVPVYCVPEKRV